MKNKITTLGYFVKRLRDKGYYCCRLYNEYSNEDPRKWTVVINPKKESVFITCFINENFDNNLFFEFNDGGVRFVKNYQLKTDSMEVIIEHLVNKKISFNT